MNIYKVTRTDELDYDEYDSFVCYAKNEEDARHTYPENDTHKWVDNNWYADYSEEGHWEIDEYSNWAKPETLSVELLGEASHSTEPGVILSSFNAG